VYVGAELFEKFYRLSTMPGRKVRGKRKRRIEEARLKSYSDRRDKKSECFLLFDITERGNGGRKWKIAAWKCEEKVAT
jgi:hypothetical protein